MTHKKKKKSIKIVGLILKIITIVFQNCNNNQVMTLFLVFSNYQKFGLERFIYLSLFEISPSSNV